MNNIGSQIRRFWAVLLICFLIVGTINPANGYAALFSDINGHWAEKEIVRAGSTGVINGYNGRFNPKGNVTRGQFTVMIVNALGLNTEVAALKNQQTGYRDLRSDHYAAGHIMVAKEKKLISGYPDGTFRPEKQIRRDEITSILVKALGLKVNNNIDLILNKFSDASDIPVWATASVSEAVGIGLLSGFPDGTFKPTRPASRGETAVLVNKLLSEFGRGFTFIGEIKDISTDTKRITVDIGDQNEAVFYWVGTSFYSETGMIQPNQLKSGDTVALIIDNNGQLQYVEKFINDYQAKAGLHAGLQVDSIKSAVAFDTPVLFSGASKAKNVKEVLVITKEGKASQVKREIEGLGGTINFYYPELSYLSASVSELTLNRLPFIWGIESINIDRNDKRLPLISAKEIASSEGNAQVGRNPQKSLAVTKAGISADTFSATKGVTGKDQIIAIIDTGIDPGHPDLRVTPENNRKIILWKDFTKEGVIDSKAIAKESKGLLNLADGNYSVGSIVSKSGVFHYGYLRESGLSSGNNEGVDINFNGVLTDVFAVLVTDSLIQGLYDSVYIDTNGNKDFSDEVALKRYELEPVFATIKSTDNKNHFNINVIEIDKSGSEIHLGFDGNDHGTHVAGITAASGHIQGVAPSAQLMALKVLDSSGYGSWSAVSEAMIYAAKHGAKIINLSLGFKPEDFVGGSVPARLIDSLTKEHGVLFVVAAGNDGPGISSLATPADSKSALSVGAFTSPEMWKTDYGWEVATDNLWFFSAVGPRGDGAMSPRILAPGSAVSTVPMRKGENYFLSEGTSMAAPHVSGSAALLLEAAKQNGITASPLMLKKAFEMGTKRISEYSLAEQGYGITNVVQAWRELQFIKEAPEFITTIFSSRIEEGSGVFETKYNPHLLNWYLKNDSGKAKELNIYTHVDWISENVDTILIPAEQEREIPLEFTIPDKPGLYSALVRADDQSTYGIDADLLATIVRPYLLNDKNNYSQSLNQTLKPAQYKRYFFKVQPGASQLNIKLSTEQNARGYNGKVRMYLYAPDGTKKAETLFAGGDSSGKSEVQATAEKPMAGTWEVVVYSSASLSDLGLSESRFTLTAALSDVGPNNLPTQERDIILSMIPREIPSDRDSYVTVQIRNRSDKKPYQGAIEINDRLYYTRKGYVTLPVKAGAKEYNFKVRTITDINKYKPLEYNFTMKIPTVAS